MANHWTKSFFDKKFYAPSSPLAMQKAKTEVGFIIKACGLKKGDALLDIACGQGRHSVELAKKGINVLGVDITESYLKDAKALAKKNKVEVYFEQADMREIKYKEAFDCAIIMFTSFGYFSKKDNLKVLKNAYTVLKKGGRFLIDVLDEDYFKENFTPQSWEPLDDNQFLIQEHDYNPKTNVCTTQWTRVGYKFKPLTRSFELQMYNEKTLTKLLKEAGFKVKKRYYSLALPADLKKKNRLVLLAQK